MFGETESAQPKLVGRFKKLIEGFKNNRLQNP